MTRKICDSRNPRLCHRENDNARCCQRPQVLGTAGVTRGKIAIDSILRALTSSEHQRNKTTPTHQVVRHKKGAYQNQLVRGNNDTATTNLVSEQNHRPKILRVLIQKENRTQHKAKQAPLAIATVAASVPMRQQEVVTIRTNTETKRRLNVYRAR